MFARREQTPPWQFGPRVELGQVGPRTADFRLEPGRYCIVLVDDRDPDRFGEFVRDLDAGGEEVLIAPRLRAAGEGDSVLVPATETELEFQFRKSSGVEIHRHPARVAAFHFDRLLVSNEQMETFLRERNPSFQSVWERTPEFQGTVTLEHWRTLPAANYDWKTCRDYAEWIGGRLPTFAETRIAALGPDEGAWVKRVAGADPESSFVIGRAPKVSLQESGEEQVEGGYLRGTLPVLHQSLGPYGLHHPIGNLAIWTATRAYDFDSGASPESTNTPLEYTDGCSWNVTSESFLKSPLSHYGTTPRQFSFWHIGLRCAKSAAV